jgi:folate/biopterin transporter
MDGEKLGVGSKGTMPIAERVCYPYVAGKRWLSGLVDTVGYQLVTFIISCHFCLKGTTLGLVGQAGLPFAQKVLKLSAQESQRYGIVASFPWSIKPLVGMISDVLPIAGYKKRYYCFLSSILGAGAIAYLAAVPLDSSSAMTYVAAMVLINLQVSVVDLLTEGKYTETMARVPEASSDIVSFVWLTVSWGGLLATVISFFVLQTDNYNVMFWCALPFSLQAVFTSFFGLLPEVKLAVSKLDVDLLTKHGNMFIMGTFMGCLSVVLAVTQLMTENMYVEFGVTLGVALVLSVSMFIFMERRLAKATLFLFLTNTVSVSFGSAMQYWFTVDETCNPGGPHFDYLFFTVYTSVIAQVFNFVGIWLFNVYLSKFRMRSALIVSALISSVASLGDFAMVMRWNLRWGIPDRWFYLIGDTILEPIVIMMAFMPSTVLISKMCPKNMEATTFAILASFSNLGGALSSSFGVFAMEAAGIKTDVENGQCDFSNLPWLIVVCGMCLPLIAVPLTFVLIPDIDMSDNLKEENGLPDVGGDTVGEKTPLIKKDDPKKE